MQVYIYAKSGHNFGLENVRRTSAIFNRLKELDPILCTADYRAATFAKYNLDVTKGVGVDLIGNMPNVMERGDILIYDDSGEASTTMQEHMKEYCTQLYKVGTDIAFDIVDEKYFTKQDTKREKAIFLADDDYANWFFELVKKSKKQDIPLLLGHYFFLGNEDILVNYFSEILEEDEYQDIVQTTKYLLTASVHTALESLASGNSPVFFKRKDKEDIQNYNLIEKYNIPVIDVDKDSFEQIISEFNTITSNYPEIKKIEKVDISSIKQSIEDILKKFAMIQPALDYKY